MTFRERRDIWALIRYHERCGEQDFARAEAIRPYAGGSNGGYTGEAENTKRPKGIPDGDEGWRVMCECYASAAVHRNAAIGLRALMGKFGAYDPVRPARRRLKFKAGTVKRALRLVGK